MKPTCFSCCFTLSSLQGFVVSDCSNTLKFPSIYHQGKVTSVVTKSECQMSLGKWIALIDVTEALLHPAWCWATSPSITLTVPEESTAASLYQTFPPLLLLGKVLAWLPPLSEFGEGKISNRSPISAWCFLLMCPENQLLPATGTINTRTDKVYSEPLFSFLPPPCFFSTVFPWIKQLRKMM